MYSTHNALKKVTPNLFPTTVQLFSFPDLLTSISSSSPSVVAHRRQTHFNASSTASKSGTHFMYCTNASSTLFLSLFTKQRHENITLAIQVSFFSLPSVLITTKYSTFFSQHQSHDWRTLSAHEFHSLQSARS